MEPAVHQPDASPAAPRLRVLAIAEAANPEWVSVPLVGGSIAAKRARAGVPFVLGPLNGGVPWPAGFDAERRRERAYLSYIRGLYRLSPGRGGMYRATAAVMAGSRHTARELPTSVQPRACLIPENGIDPSRFNTPSQQAISGPLRCAFVGRLVPYKGPDMLIEAAADLLRAGHLTLDILGDGPMMPALVDLVARLGLRDHVTLHGWVDHRAVQDILSSADLIAGFRRQLAAIVANPQDLPRLSAAARQRVADHFTWDKKARQIGQIYTWALDPKGPIPTPLPPVGT